ncbi:MAG: hypothetical protein JXL80_00865 [Planctomycetes bacterium]|nr:hypothetical protein [Planctomycetota bacterium]
MTLKFFRKHKKYGNILLLGALFAMVTFGALAYLPDLLQRMEHKAESEKPVYELKNYHLNVSAREDWDIKANLRGTGQLQALLVQALQPNHPLSRELSPAQLQVLFRYQSPMPNKFLQAGGAAEREMPEEALKVVYATAILLKEAEQAGVVVTEEMARLHYNDWLATQIRPEVLGGVLRLVFFEDQARVVPANVMQQRLLSAIRQEMTLSLYLNSLRTGARIFNEDVDDVFRLALESAEVDKVSLGFRRYLKGVAEPTEEQIAAAFEQNKDKLAADTETGFGCKVPDRVRFEYLKVKADALAADIEIADEEIAAYYEENKDREFVVTEDDAKSGKVPDAAKPGDVTPQAPVETPSPNSSDTAPEAKGDQAATQDETANDGGGVGVPTPLAQATTGQAESATESRPAAPVAGGEGQAPVAQPVPAQPAAGAGQAETPNIPAKNYKPLAEVCDEIRAMLQNQKAAAAARKKAEDILSQLLLRPMLSLENMADEKYVAYYPAGEFLTRDQIRLLPGIGTAMKESNNPSQRWPTFFGDMVFSIEPFEKKPEIYLNRPAGVLTDGTKSAYIFVVTEVQEAHVPASVDEVRDIVVRNLKKEAAYRMAELEAAEIVALAKEKGLEAAVKEKVAASSTVEERIGDQVPQVRPGVVRRPTERYDDPESKAVFQAVDAGETFGTVGDEQLDRVTVFQIKKVSRTKQSDYTQRLAMFTVYAMQQRQMKLLDGLTDPERLIARSGFTVSTPQKQSSDNDSADDGDQ